MLKLLHREYQDKIAILLYPSDEFGQQELPSAEVPAFVTGKGLPTDGGGCHLMQKVKTNGADADAAWKLAKGAFLVDAIHWNFDGIFLFDASGTPAGRYTADELPQVRAKLAQLVAACAA